MGAKSTKTSQATAITNVNHVNFSSACLVGEGLNQLIQTTMSVDQGTWTKWKNQLANSGLQDIYLMLPKSNQYSSKGMCSTSGILKLKFPNYPYLLKDQIEKRADSNQYFEESDLWFLLNCLLQAQQQVANKNHTKVGDIRPQNIFISDDGEIKVSTLLSWPGQVTNFAKTFEKEKTYVSPQQVSRLDKGQAQVISDTTSELFSIGLTLISSALLKDSTVIYGNGEIDRNQYQSLLFQWRKTNRYSEIFRSLISNLCCFDQQRRLTSAELWNWIQTYENSIQRKENFLITNVPQKLQREVTALQIFLCKWKPSLQEHIAPQISPLNLPFSHSVAYHGETSYVQRPIQRVQFKQPLQFIGNTQKQVIPAQEGWKSPSIPTLTQLHMEGTSGWQNENNPAYDVPQTSQKSKILIQNERPV